MSHTLELLAEVQHGTVAGYFAGCHGSPISCGGVVSCATVYTRYSGDWGFRKRIDAGEDAADIYAAELAEVEAVRARDRAANRKAKEEGARAARVREVKQRKAREPRPVKPPRVPMTARIGADVERLHAEGLLDVEIAARLDVSSWTVTRVRKARGLPRLHKRIDRAEIARLNAEGMSDVDIAATLGISVHTVGVIRRELGLPKVTRALTARNVEIARMVAEGASDAEIAERLGTTRQAVSQARRKQGILRDTTPRAPRARRAKVDHTEEITRLHAEGLTDREIADTIGLAQTTVSRIRRELKLPALTTLPWRRDPSELAGHGTNASFARGCRCDECREANREYMRAYRERRRAAGPGEYHGTAYGYQMGCRGTGCPSRPSCTHMMLEQDRARRRAAGVPAKELVDAGPVRAHVRDLHAAGMTYQRVAEAAGVPFTTVKSLMFSRGVDRPRVEQLLASRAAEILAVPIPEPS